MTESGSLRIVRYQTPPPNFTTIASVTSGSGMSGLLPDAIVKESGSSNMRSWGDLLKYHHIEDPTRLLADAVAQGLKKASGPRRLIVDPKVLLLPIPSQLRGLKTVDGIKALKGRYPKGYVLAISTPMETFVYQVLHWRTYNYILVGHASLLHFPGPQVLWQENCTVSGARDDTHHMDITDITSDKTTRMRDVMQDAAVKCGHQLISAYLAR